SVVISPPAHAMATLNVAIIGGGPAGLGAAIALSRIPNVNWNLYEKKPEISEISNGLTLQPTTWRMLEAFGAAHLLQPDDFFRPEGGHRTEHRNGRTGVLVKIGDVGHSVPPHQDACRIHRAKLQNALRSQVEEGRIWVSRKLVSVQNLPSGKVHIEFEDGHSDDVDLLVGADGIRSVVRRFAFPDYTIGYTGSTAYRTLVSASEASKINGLPRQPIFWHGTDGKWAYTCPLGGDDWEITCSVKEPDGDARSSWGKKGNLQHFVSLFSEMCTPMQRLLGLATYVEQYDYFAGSRIDTVVSQDSIALIGDASHPLSGAFGAGAGFALEDAYVLGRAVSWAAEEGRPLGEALRILDDVRSPHYKALYEVLDEFAKVEKDLRSRSPRLDASSEIDERISGRWSANSGWMHHYRVRRSTIEPLLDFSS
ncbi:salicylate hydroxylase, partial [Geosmithia morbida]